MIKNQPSVSPQGLNEQLRKLTKQFKCLAKPEISLLLEFCEYDQATATKVLIVLSDLLKPQLIVKELLDKPEQSEQIIQRYLDIYHQKYEGDKTLEGLEEEEVKETKLDKVLPFFRILPQQLVFQIALFLNPLQISYLAKIDSGLSRIIDDHRLLMDMYYRRICKVLLSNPEPELPSEHRFHNIRNYILSHPLEFSPNIRNLANLSIRDLVWQRSPTELRVNREYYESMVRAGGFKNLYMNAPRLHFNGYYMLKQKYVRRGEKTLYTSSVPYYVISYYRYIRFFEDGSVLVQVSNRKLKDSQIIEVLSRKKLGQGSMEGEHMRYKDTVYVKFARDSSIFSYEFNIVKLEEEEEYAEKSTEGLGVFFGGLKVKKFNLEIMDESMIVMNINKNESQEDKIFRYFRHEGIAGENSLPIQGCSL